MADQTEVQQSETEGGPKKFIVPIGPQLDLESPHGRDALS